MPAIILLVIGAALCVTGAAVIYWPAALVVGGVFSLAAGIDLSRP